MISMRQSSRTNREFYNVEDIADLTSEQMNEVRAFVDNELSEYSLCNEGLLMCLIITKTISGRTWI